MNNTCKEFVLDDLMAVTAVPVTDYSPAFSAWQVAQTIPSQDFSPTLVNAVTIGVRPAADGVSLIPIIRNSGKAKDDSSDSVSGRLHTVTVTCNADDRDPSVWNLLLALERTPSHAILMFRDGTRAFVQATRDTYQCSAEREGAKTSVRMRITNIMGIQLIR